jgi:hypothetical protein
MVVGPPLLRHLVQPLLPVLQLHSRPHLLFLRLRVPGMASPFLAALPARCGVLLGLA